MPSDRTSPHARDDRTACSGPIDTDALLRLATELVTTLPAGSNTAYLPMMVTVRDMAVRLGRSRTTIYRLWPTQEDFWADMALYVAEEHRGVLARVVAGGSPVPAPTGGALDALLRRVVADETEPAETLSWFSLLSYMGDNHALAKTLASRRRAVHHALAGQLEALMGPDGLRPRRPLTFDDLAIVLSGAAEAAAALVLMEGRRDGEAARLGAEALALIGSSLTEPADPADRPAPLPAHDGAAFRPERRDPRQGEILSAARRLLFERIATDRRTIVERVGRPRLPFSRLARAAGVARQTIYNRWPDEDAFELALLDHVLEVPIRLAPPIEVDPETEDAAEQHETGAFAHEVSRLTVDRAVATSYLPYLANPQIQARFAPFADRTIRSGPALLDRVVAALGRRLRADADATVVGLARLAILIGVAYEHRADPMAAWHRGDAGHPWPLPAVASALLIRTVTEPADP